MRVTSALLVLALAMLCAAVTTVTAIATAEQAGQLSAADAATEEQVVTMAEGVVEADDADEDVAEAAADEEVDDEADEEEADHEAAFVEAVTRARTDGLLAWWGPSAQTVDELTVEGDVTATARAFTEAATRLHDEGEDVHDLSPSRFAQVELSAGVSVQVSAQLALQAQRRAEAAERRAVASVSVSGALVCRAIVQAVRRYRNANARGGAAAIPPLAEVTAAVVRDVEGAAETDVRKLWPIVMYRMQYRGDGPDVACNPNALGLAMRAVARTAVPVGGTLSDFAMGLEEEYSDVRMNPDSENVAGLAVSGNVPAPRMAPYIKICPDHTMPPKGYPRGKPYGVIEVATGPLPIGWEARRAHRRVTALWRKPLPPPPQVLEEGLPTSLLRLTREFNENLPRDLKPYEMPLEKLRRDHDDFEITDYPNTNMPINSIQTNFEASLCAVFDNPHYAALHVDSSQRALLVAARAAAKAFLSTADGDDRIAGVRKAEVDALPAQQKCELHGLFTVAFMHSMYWGAQGAVRDLNAKPNTYVPIHPNGGTPKNFFSVMVKTNLRDIVDRTPFPLADVVHTFYEASLGDNRQKVRTAMYKALTTALRSSVHPLMRAYAGPVTNLRAPGAERFRPLTPLRPWLSADGAFFDSALRGLGARPLYNPTASSPIGDRAPPASVWRNPAVGGAVDANGELPQQIVVVCEARFQTEPLNRAMTAQGVEPYQLPRGWKTHAYGKSLVEDLKRATSSYHADAGTQPWRVAMAANGRDAPAKPAARPPAVSSSTTEPEYQSSGKPEVASESTAEPVTAEVVA